MMKGKHFTFEDRKVIASGLAHDKKCVEIAEKLQCDPTAVAKEIKRNRVDCTRSRYVTSEPCPFLKRFPYICKDCKCKYTKCEYHQFHYDAKIAQCSADRKLKESRIGINLTLKERDLLVSELKNGIEKKISIYQIAENLPFKISEQTIYRYIREILIPIKPIDLPFATTYKKRKVHKKEYEYNENKIDRTDRTFLDYIAFTKSTNLYTTQLDFLGSKKKDPKCILTLIIVEIHFTFIFLIENKNSDKVISIFDQLEKTIGFESFKEIFGLILTDRDPCFTDFGGIEASKINDGQKRTNIFYCDAYRSNQKGSVENMNKQLRQFFPKGYRLDDVDENKVRQINIALNQKKIKSLDGFSPEEAFIKIFGKDIFEKLFVK